MAIEPGTAVGQVMLERLNGSPAQGDDSILHAFAEHPDAFDGQVEVSTLDAAQFAGAKAGSVEHLKDGDIPTEQRALGIGRGDELIDLGAAEDLGEGLLGFGPLELL